MRPNTVSIYSFSVHQQAKYERAQLIGKLFADAFIWIGKQFSKITSKFRPVPSLDQCTDAEDVIRYANSIRKTQPNFADELMAAANRTD